MPKNRAITGFGPHVIELTGTTGTTETSAWRRFGPFQANRANMRVVWSDTSAGNSLRLEGLLLGGNSSGVPTSTQAGTSLIIRTSTQTLQVASTVALWYSHIRLATSGLVNGVTGTAHIIAGA